MKYKLSVLSEASVDIDLAYIWYEMQQMGLGDKFFDILNQSIQSIQKNPFLYQGIYEGVRRCAMKNFPYGIYYKIIIDSFEIQVIGVIDFRRDPTLIMKRL